VWHITQPRLWMVVSEGELAEELHSVQQVWERICEVLCSRLLSVHNRIEQTVEDRL
jgi:hypothetical protein